MFVSFLSKVQSTLSKVFLSIPVLALFRTKFISHRVCCLYKKIEKHKRFQAFFYAFCRSLDEEI